MIWKDPQSTKNYCQISNISYILVGNKIADHSNVVGALPVGAAPTTSSFSNTKPLSEWMLIYIFHHMLNRGLGKRSDEVPKY